MAGTRQRRLSGGDAQARPVVIQASPPAPSRAGRLNINPFPQAPAMPQAQPQSTAAPAKAPAPIPERMQPGYEFSQSGNAMVGNMRQYFLAAKKAGLSDEDAEQEAMREASRELSDAARRRRELADQQGFEVDSATRAFRQGVPGAGGRMMHARRVAGEAMLGANREVEALGGAGYRGVGGEVTQGIGGRPGDFVPGGRMARLEEEARRKEQVDAGTPNQSDTGPFRLPAQTPPAQKSPSYYEGMARAEERRANARLTDTRARVLEATSAAEAIKILADADLTAAETQKLLAMLPGDVAQQIADLGKTQAQTGLVTQRALSEAQKRDLEKKMFPLLYGKSEAEIKNTLSRTRLNNAQINHLVKKGLLTEAQARAFDAKTKESQETAELAKRQREAEEKKN
jgi:hypothetical protein